ncbi:MAG: hypothetical protein KZQ77_13510, partial [Candidatus Thiodiazotropha sp. (ex Notomyrtea botanica)]|nr:hypothetical protein [Candidatus Thiodiazotropha sp. (ex Notomyrtea botanica)]
IRNNTVANNDSTATGSQAFEITNPNMSIPQPAGVVSRLHGPIMSQLVNIDDTAGDVLIDPATLRHPDGALFSDIFQRNNIVYHNRSFFWLNFDDPATAINETGLFPATAACLADFSSAACSAVDLEADAEDFTNDLGVMSGSVEVPATEGLLDVRTSLLQDGELVRVSPGANQFITGDAGFVNGYFNTSRDGFLFPEFKTLATAGAFDEGGNFLQVAFGPLSLVELDGVVGNAEGPLFDYHLTAASAAINNGGNVGLGGRLGVDIDNEARPNGGNNDIGADEAM